MSDVDFSIDVGIDLTQTKRVELVHPVNGKPLLDDKGAPWYVDVISSKSDEVKSSLKSIMARYRSIARKNKGIFSGELNQKQSEECQAEIHALVMSDWHIGTKPGGPALKVPCDKQNAYNWCLANELFHDQISSGADDLSAYATELGNAPRKK